MRKTEFLSPRRKLVEEVVAWLCRGERVRLQEGAHSLAHLLVVVPTAQSGRNLRLALAKKAAEMGWGGVLPPRVAQPFQLVVPADQSMRDADEAEIAALFLSFLAARKRIALESWPHLFQRTGKDGMELQALLDKDAGFALLNQMTDIWHALAGNGLLMRDVPADEGAARVLAAALGDDQARWSELASFETEFFAFVRSRGLRHPVESIALAKTAAAPLDPEIDEIVLPALADPIFVLTDVLGQYARDIAITTLLPCDAADGDRFDEWGRPKVEKWTGDARPVLEGLSDDDIVSLPDNATLAARIVDDFPASSSGQALPALGLCDAELFTELSAAFLNAARQVHNPERNRLAVSSLGMLLRDLLALWRPGDAGAPWPAFAAFMRSDDVLAAAEPEALPELRSRVLHGLDVYQNKCLPTFAGRRLSPPSVELSARERAAVEAFVERANTLLSWLEDARRGVSLVAFLREMLRRIFAHGRFDGIRSAKEFAQAAACVRDALDALASDVVEGLGLPDADRMALARRLFDAASYSLESDSKDVIKTAGWLELVWSLDDQIALAGFHEGQVPDSVVGHAFLPNELRAALGLMTNETRLARDTWLLKELLDSHAPHAVRAYVSRTNGNGDICRPSRLLFLCSDAALAARVKGLFGDAGEIALTPPRKVSKAWRPRVPDEAALKRDEKGRSNLSPSAIDAYLKSPFGYLLRYGMGMRDRHEEKRELGFDDYGTFVHRVLETFANEQKERPLLNEAAIAQALKAILDREVARFGARPTVNVRLQLRSACDRLMRFAAIQAQWAQEGWRVEGTEVKFSARPFADLDVVVRGSVDRVDRRDLPDGSREFRIVDYKTWDELKSAKSRHIRSEAAKEIAFADRLKLPTRPSGKAGRKRERMLTIQLPLYGACLKADDPERFAGPITEYDYLVLAEDEVGVIPVKDYVDFSLWTAQVAIRRIKANLFWPPRADEDGRLYDFGRLFSLSPERDFGTGADVCDWLARQEAKLKELEDA